MSKVEQRYNFFKYKIFYFDFTFNFLCSFCLNRCKFCSSSIQGIQSLFNKDLNRAQIKIAEARREESILYFRQTLLNAGTEVNNALTQYQTAKSQQSLHLRQIKAMESAVTSTELLMVHGSTTYLEIFTARQGLLSAQLLEVSDRFGEIQSIIGLYRAFGGGGDRD
jgi:outer membrane protein TolC